MQPENAVNARKIICSKCNRIFKNRRALEQHQKAVHFNGFICQNCRKQFNSQNALDQHCRDKGCKPFTSENLFKCILCDKTFKTKYSLTQHINAKHFIMSTDKRKEIQNAEILTSSLVIVRDRSEDLISEVSGFKCPHCGCEKAVYNTSNAPLYSKRPHLFIICSRCGKGFRDTDF